MIKRSDILTEDFAEVLRRHAIEAYPEEAIGVLLASGYRRLTNVSPEPHLYVAAYCGLYGDIKHLPRY